MLTDTTDRTKHNTNHRGGGSLPTIAVVAALFCVGVVSVRAQTGTISNEVAKLLASDGSTNDHFGKSIAMSGDTVIIGAPSDDDNGGLSGSAYIFVRDANGVWAQQAKLLSSDGAGGDLFGESVAMSGDTAVVGARFSDGNVLISGSAYIFVRDANGLWTQQAKLVADDGALEDLFGFSVALSGDTVVVGAFWDDNNTMIASGSAYVFVRNANGVWTQQFKLIPNDGSAADEFGYSVSIDGDTAVVGAWQDGDNGSQSGSAYIFTRDAAGVWTQQTKLLASDGSAVDQFGSSVAVSGETAFVVSMFSDGNVINSGSAYVFMPDAGGVWSQQTKFFASDGQSNDWFGSSIALSGDTAVIGAFLNDDTCPSNPNCNSGSAYVFVRDTNGVWTQNAKVLASDGSQGDWFGSSVALSGDKAVVGSLFNDGNVIFSGSAYIFNLGSPSDLNGDGIVNAADLATLLAQWGCLAPANCPADLNGDGTVDAADLAFLLANWS